MERRPADDGCRYTLQDLEDYYGAFYLAHWQRADADAGGPGQEPAGRGAGAATPGEEPRADGTPPARDAAGADTPGEVPHARGTEGASVWDGPDRVGPAGRLGEDARPWKRGSTQARPAEGGELDPHFCPCCRFWLSGPRQWEGAPSWKEAPEES